MQPAAVTEKTPEIKIAQPVQTGSNPKTNAFRLPDLKNLHEAVVAGKGHRTEKATVTQEVFTTDTSVQIEQEKLRDVLNRFAEEKKSQDRMNHFVLLSERSFVTEGNKIILHIDNPVQKDHFSSVRKELGDYLKEKLGLSSVYLDVEIVETEQKKVLYTTSDKYRYLAEKYPVLEELKKRLGLETDF